MPRQKMWPVTPGLARYHTAHLRSKGKDSMALYGLGVWSPSSSVVRAETSPAQDFACVCWGGTPVHWHTGITAHRPFETCQKNSCSPWQLDSPQRSGQHHAYKHSVSTASSRWVTTYFFSPQLDQCISINNIPCFSHSGPVAICLHYLAFTVCLGQKGPYHRWWLTSHQLHLL